MRPRQALSGSFHVLGGRIPVVVGLIIGLTLAASVLGALGLRFVLVEGILDSSLVGAGQVWRLLTWVFFARDPLGLLFACLTLWWAGSDLVRAWGPVRFLRVYLGLTVATGVATCIAALLLWRGSDLFAYGPWPLVSALIIAWAIVHPHQDVYPLFVPVGLRGRNLIYCTVGITVLFAAFGGLADYVPHFLAQGLMMAYLRQPLRRLWLRFRFALQQRSLRRRASYLRPIDRSKRSEPPRWLH